MTRGAVNIRLIRLLAVCLAISVFAPSAAHAACSNPAGAEGDMTYNTTHHMMQFCDDTDWIAMAGSSTCGWSDFNFTDLLFEPPSMLVVSNILPINISGTVNISGNGSPEYRICTNSICSVEAQTWGSASGAITSGQLLQLRLTSNATEGVTNSATVTIGSSSDQWSVSTTEPVAGCPAIGDVCSDGTIYAGLSPDGSVPMYTTAADEGLFSWNNGNSSNQTATGQTSTVTGETNTANIVPIDSDSGTGGTQPHQAAQQCTDKTSSGRNDWYLPAKDELTILYNNKVAIGGFDLSNASYSGWYWSSTEGGNNARIFGSGGLGSLNKMVAASVRCVRK